MFPAISIVVYFLYVIALFVYESLFLFSALSSLALILLIVLPQKKLKSGLIPISIFIVVTFLANALFNSGKIIMKAGPFTVTEEGVYTAAIRTLRVFLLIAGAKFLTIIAELDEMIGAMGRLFSPLERIGVPVKEFFGMMALAVNALPLIRKRIGEEYGRKISLLERRTINARVRVVFAFLLPLFIKSIRNPESILSDSRSSEHDDQENGPSEIKWKGAGGKNGRYS